VFEPTIRVWRSGTTRKQPVNLAVEAAEESLSISTVGRTDGLTLHPHRTSPAQALLTILADICLNPNA
jgi:hypothetical protein